jgi:hypothetical protein
MSSNPLPVRMPLDVLQLDCPDHLLSTEVVHGRRFFIAQARHPGITPRWVMADSVERLGQKLRGPSLNDFSRDQPNIARVWDFMLGGKDNFTEDRELAGKIIQIYPRAPVMARDARNFQWRMATVLAGEPYNVTQFLDIGCGLPAKPNTHETVQAVRDDARVVYVDNDPMVLSHARSILAKDKGVTIFGGDIAYPSEILYNWTVRKALDFSRPIGVLLLMVLHFYDVKQARKIVADIINSVPFGSYLAVSIARGDPAISAQVAGVYTPSRVCNHSASDLARILDGLDLIEPGITEATRWRNRAPQFTTGEEAPKGQVWVAAGQVHKKVAPK